MSQDIFIAIQPITGNEVYITPDASTIEQVNVNVQPFSGDQVYINVQPDTGAQINVSVSPNMLGVYLVNGRDGAVTLDKSDVNLSNVENVSITGTSGYLQEQINNIDISSGLTGISGYFQNQFDNLDLNYATDLNLSQTGSNLQSQINNLYNSGFITGIDLSPYYLASNPSGFITGIDLSTYATLSNLELTGQNLQNQINNIDITSQLTGVSGYFQNQFNNLDLNYASDLQLSQTGAALNTKIDNLSGYFNDQDVLAYTAELESGQESAFLPYPTVLSQPPSSITCAFQNNIDNIIYNYSLKQINTSGFYINFSDVLTNSGYLLKIQVKK
jgi:hypothetical protein